MTDEELNERFDTLEKMVALVAALGRVLLENTGKTLTQESERMQTAANRRLARLFIHRHLRTSGG